MNYQKLEQYTSAPRLNRFLRAVGNSKVKAKRLYQINLQVSQSFYPILNLFEIFLRNAIDRQLKAYFEDDDWIITQKTGFMNHPSLSSSRYSLKNSITKAERTIRSQRNEISSPGVIAEQSFGFWTSLFDPHHYRLINGTIIHCFSCKPGHVNRSTISQKLNRIRKFRNRIYHNEPICFFDTHIDFQNAEKVREEIFETTAWIDKELLQYIRKHDSTNSKIKQVYRL